MSQVILVTAGRGGAGKSLVCALLGEALAAQGREVLLVEASRRSLDVLFEVSDRVVFDLSDAAARRCELTDAMLPVGATGRMRLICAPAADDFVPDAELWIDLVRAADAHFDYILIEADGSRPAELAPVAAAVSRAVIVCAPDRVSARAGRAASDALFAAGVTDILLCVNMITPEFLKLRPIPDLDWLIDEVCAQLICILPFDRDLISFTAAGQLTNLSNISKMVFDNFAQRIMENYIDLLVQ